MPSETNRRRLVLSGLVLALLATLSLGLATGGGCKIERRYGDKPERIESLQEVPSRKYRTDEYLITVVDVFNVVCLKPLRMPERKTRGEIVCYRYEEGVPSPEAIEGT